MRSCLNQNQSLLSKPTAIHEQPAGSVLHWRIGTQLLADNRNAVRAPAGGGGGDCPSDGTKEGQVDGNPLISPAAKESDSLQGQEREISPAVAVLQRAPYLAQYTNDLWQALRLNTIPLPALSAFNAPSPASPTSCILETRTPPPSGDAQCTRHGRHPPGKAGDRLQREAKHQLAFDGQQLVPHRNLSTGQGRPAGHELFNKNWRRVVRAGFSAAARVEESDGGKAHGLNLVVHVSSWRFSHL
jgi:hypothetical protein